MWCDTCEDAAGASQKAFYILDFGYLAWLSIRDRTEENGRRRSIKCLRGCRRGATSGVKMIECLTKNAFCRVNANFRAFYRSQRTL